MKRTHKRLLKSMHIPIFELGNLSASDLLAIEGPKFITSDTHEGARTYAVLISHNQWKIFNHRVPNVNPRKAEQFFVGDQAYIVIPVERDAHKCWRPLPETGLKIVTERSDSKKRCAE